MPTNKSPFDFDDDDPPARPEPRPRQAARTRSRPGARFRAELDLTELDERKRPGPTWTGRGYELSRSHLTLRSRRMCYEGRLVLVAVHLVDDRPVPLFGEVTFCEYDGEGQYRTELLLRELPDGEEVRGWVRSRDVRGTL